LTVFENTFIKFYTVGSRKMGESGIFHGRLVDMYQPEKGIGYKIKIMPSWIESIKAKIIPTYDPYIILPIQEEDIFMPSLFNMSIEELIYKASMGESNINLFYIGSYNTGDPMADIFNSAVSMDRIVWEKDAYKHALYESQKALAHYIKHSHEVDYASIEYIMKCIERIKKTDQKPINKAIKHNEDLDVHEGIRMDESDRGKGILAELRKL